MKRAASYLPLLALALLTAFGGVTALYAIDTSSALYTSNIQFLNLGLSRTNFAGATEISGSALIDDAFMEADTLNAVIHEGPVEIPSMPPNNRIVVEGSVVDDGGSFSEFTSEAQDSTELDVALLPASPEVDDAHYFGCDNPCRIITVDIGQEAVADSLSLQWEYYNGTTFTTASNVDDRSEAFTLAGQRTISFDMPSDFATTTVTGSAVEAFWVRARVTEVDNPTQQAIANQEWYENGQWWTWGRSLSINEELLYSLSLGGPDLVTNHQIFPGNAGIVTPDDASIELGDTYAIHWDGALDFTQGTSGSDVCILCKPNALRLYISDADTNELTLDVTGSGTTSLSIAGIPAATAAVTGTTPHVLDIVSDGTDLTFAVDDVDTQTGTAQTITDNSNDWEWMSNGAATFGNTMYLMPDETSLATDSFDSEAEWDTGTLTDMVSTGGQAEITQQHLSEASADDGTWTETDSGFNNSTNFTWFGYQDGVSGPSNAFYRFDNLRIAQGATINSADLTFTPWNTNSNATVSVAIAAIDDDDASAPGTFSAAENATRTSASVSWSPVPTFTDGSLETSPDISTVIQEIVDRPGWSSGNAIVVYVEDAGSTTSNDTRRFACSFEGECEAVRLNVVVDDGQTLTNDFIEQEATAQDTGNDGFIEDWTQSCTGTGCVSRVEGPGSTDPRARYGVQSMRIRSGTSTGTSGIVRQDISASPGEVWSFQFDVVYLVVDDSTAEANISWLDSSSSIISTNTVAVSANSSSYQTYSLNNETAPANTASVRIQFKHDCTATCTSGNRGMWVDGVVACVCNPAPSFPDASNLVQNPSFEQIYQTSATWLSPTISLGQSNVASSSINWTELVPFDATITVETSLSGGAFIAVNNGDSIPGISPGDDVSSDTLRIRVTMTPSTESSQVFTAAMPLMSTLITDDVLEDDAILFYELRTTPGVTIEDLSPNSNDGTMSYPVQLSGIFASITPLRSNRTPISQEAALGAGDFASAVTGSESSLNLFGQDTGEFLPGGEVINEAFNEINAPIEFFWVLLISALGIGFGAIVWRATNGNELAVSLVLGGTVVVAAALGSGLIPGWVPIVTIMLLVVWNVMRSRLPI